MLPPPQTHFVDALPDENEAQHLLNRNRLRLVRAGLAGLSFVAAVAVLACAAHSLGVYNRTSLPAEWGLPLWATDLTTSPTKGVLGASCVVALSSLLFVAAAFVPRVYLQPTILNATAAASAMLGLVLSVFAIAFSDSYDGRRNSSTIGMWSCRWSGLGNDSPVNFNRVCSTTEAAHALLICLICFQTLMLGLTALGFWMESRVKALRGFRLEDRLEDKMVESSPSP